MPQYLSPGVYVEEVPSAVQGIVGVSTSTAGFIGKCANDMIVIPPGPVSRVEAENVGTADGTETRFVLKAYPVLTKVGTFTVQVDGTPQTAVLVNNFSAGKAEVVFETAPAAGAVTVTYDAFAKVITGEAVGVIAESELVAEAQVQATGDGKTKSFLLDGWPVITRIGEYRVFATVDGQEIDFPNAVLQNDGNSKQSKVVFKSAPPDKTAITVKYKKGKELRLAQYPVLLKSFSCRSDAADLADTDYQIVNDFRSRTSYLQLTANPGTIRANYLAVPVQAVVHRESIGKGDAATMRFPLTRYPIDETAGMFAARNGDYRTASVVSDATIEMDKENAKAWVVFTNAPALNTEIWIDYVALPTFKPLKNQVKLCTSFSAYRKHFGDFSTDPDLNMLAHGVYGFFHNGGSRCYVGVMDNDIDTILEQFGAIDEIAIVAAPGLNNEEFRDKIVTHCEVATQDRFAIFDSPETLADDDLTLLSPYNPDRVLPSYSDYAAFYFPWIQVTDPAEKTIRLNDKDIPANEKGRVYMPPSGHLAGIYARVDNTRGVFKAPANEVILGALGLKYKISKAQQDGLNPQGVNCLREINGGIKVWGARTVGGDANGEWRYINVRRSMLFLRESIDEGTQWAVFEPNDRNLWAKITRNVSAFLTTQWQSGMLFGATPAEAFYVKCDDETNPPELREIGQVVTEIGVSIVRPAEFVIFRITQWQPQTA
ncbi:MAG: phage tail sheath subtilisin-like domain-containing protein [Caldilineaceae bacterium]|nr:phage tail sheath subtilisin-like domain-containing protein [Caldilineaceae bacterium]